jgi:hypothetical protein
VIVACRKADVIIGPIAMTVADSLLGEITAKMALAVARADAVRIFVPLTRCDNLVAGVSDVNTGELIADALLKLRGLINSRFS